MKTGLKHRINNVLVTNPNIVALGSSRRSGFTLMEIMVVVVIIAVLASVAGPMIGDLVNQGKESATKSNMAALKSALISYKNDVGRFPYKGTKDDKFKKSSYSQDNVLASSTAFNVLVNAATPVGATGENFSAYSADPSGDDKYSSFYGKEGRKWKGPYMDASPNEFMFDAWGNRIIYAACGHSLVLWSYGADGEPAGTDPETLVTKNKGDDEDGPEHDDIVVTVSRFKRKFKD